MNTLRNQIPLLHRIIKGKQLIYFDFAATAPKPQSVINAISDYYANHAGNPGRSTHCLAYETSLIIEHAREKVLTYFKGNQLHTAIFTKSATESINFIAHSIGERYKEQAKKPTLIITEAEHHSNFLPWLRLHKEEGFPLVIIPVDTEGVISEAKVIEVIKQTQGGILALTHASNVSGQVVKLEQITKEALINGVTTIVDASQSAAHIPIDLGETPVDYLVASAHKMYGPEGVGVLLAKNSELEVTVPLITGGGAVEQVTTEGYSFKKDLARFEAGTPNSAGIAGFSKALDFIGQAGGLREIHLRECELGHYLYENLMTIKDVLVVNNQENPDRAAIYSFVIPRIHPHDIADYLDQEGIAVRAGLHCAEPLHRAINLKGSVRVSLSFLNTTEEIDFFISTLKKCLQKYA